MVDVDLPFSNWSMVNAVDVHFTALFITPQPKTGVEGIVVFPRLCGLTSLCLLNKDEQENYITKFHERPSLKERNEEQQYHVVLFRMCRVGLKWEFGDRQAGPCMGRCMGGAWVGDLVGVG